MLENELEETEEALEREKEMLGFRKDEEITELREQIESNQMVTAELLENMEDVRKVGYFVVGLN